MVTGVLYNHRRVLRGTGRDPRPRVTGSREESSAHAELFAFSGWAIRARTTLITNTLAKDKEIEDRWRRFPRPDLVSRNLANFRRGRSGRRAD
jgi:hypothetical protein